MVASWGRVFLAVVAIAVFALAQAAGEDNAFMPKGGRVLLLELLGTPVKLAELRSIVQTRRTEPEWRDFVTARKQAMGERELATLSAYLAVNMPLPADAGSATISPQRCRPMDASSRGTDAKTATRCSPAI